MIHSTNFRKLNNSLITIFLKKHQIKFVPMPNDIVNILNMSKNHQQELKASLDHIQPVSWTAWQNKFSWFPLPNIASQNNISSFLYSSHHHNGPDSI